MSLLLGVVLCMPQAEPVPAFVVENRAPIERQQVLPVSMPFPRGLHAEVKAVSVNGEVFPCLTMIRWPDGSVALVQLHTRLKIPKEQRSRFEVHVLTGAESEHVEIDRPWLFPDRPELSFEFRDPWGRLYRAKLEPDSSVGTEGWLPGTSLLRSRRYVSAFHLVEDPKQVALTLRAYLTQYRGERRAELTVVLDNQSLAGPAFGPMRFSEFAIIAPASLRIRPHFIRENLLREPTLIDGGGYRQVLLGPSDQLYLGDRTAKAFRFDLYAEGAQDSDRERELARWQVRQPLVALPDLAWVRATGAFGAHGGPAPVSKITPSLASAQLMSWRLAADFGPFAGFGDPRDAAAQGTPRNGPCSLHNVLRWSSAGLLAAAEGMVLQQALRPTPGRSPRLPEATLAWRQGLSQRTITRPHGFTALDYEHFSVDLLYDYYWLTGDPFALDELRRIGSGLLPLLEALPFATSRGEGWCLQAGVLIARASGDDDLLAALLERFERVILPVLGAASASYAIPQPPHPEALQPGVDFDLPWQMAALIYGFHALYQQTGDLRVRDAIGRVAMVMARAGWLDGVGPKYLVSASDPQNFSMPVGFGPLEGTAWMQIGAFVLAAELADSEVDRSLFRQRADFLSEPHLVLGKDPSRASAIGGAAANPWFQIHLDRRSSQH